MRIEEDFCPQIAQIYTDFIFSDVFFGGLRKIFVHRLRRFTQIFILSGTPVSCWQVTDVLLW